MAKAKVVGVNIGGFQIQIGPNENIQFMYVLLDRAFIYYAHIINWAHGRRGLAEENPVQQSIAHRETGYTTKWDEASKKLCARFFNHVRHDQDSQAAKKQLVDLIKQTLDGISRGSGDSLP